ncbi:MAG: hypothetical protein HQL26_10170 [Candidatus Omnitrophica bacterium]|nr:hypothetical protein [Candidatus Omnitrophota bacterium]
MNNFRIKCVMIWIFLVLICSGDIFNEAEAKPSLSYQDVKSVTFYDFGTTPAQQFINLQNELPDIKAAGFNTVWLVNPWADYNPDPLSNPSVYSEKAFADLRKTLALIKSNGMYAIIGLNYLGKGWSPKGIDSSIWLEDPIMYHAFETYVTEFLNRIKDYNETVFILFFTENSEPDHLAPYYFNRNNNATKLCGLLRQTLGSLPTRLPAQLRSLYSIGYHDYTLINFNWALGDTPISSPNPFDFLSMVAYGFENMTEHQIADEINLRSSRFKNLYPGTPLIIGEVGSNNCEGEINQARVEGAIVSQALKHRFGFNVWGWKAGPDLQVCSNGSMGGFNLTNQESSSNFALVTLKSVLKHQATRKASASITMVNAYINSGKVDKDNLIQVFEVTNESNFAWTLDGDNSARLRYHLYNEKGKLIHWDAAFLVTQKIMGGRVVNNQILDAKGKLINEDMSQPAMVYPGQKILIRMSIALKSAPNGKYKIGSNIGSDIVSSGTYILGFDMVGSDRWFDNEVQMKLKLQGSSWKK